MINLPSYSFRSENDRIIDLKAGMSISALTFTFAATNDTGQTLAKSDLGTIRWLERDQVVWEAKLEDIIEFNARNRRHGTAYFASATAGAVLAHFDLPMRFNGDNNVVRITEKTAIQLVHSSLTSILTTATNTMQVFMKSGVGIESYRPSFHRYDRSTVSGRSDAQPLTGFENIAFMTLVYDANHTQALLTKNGDILYDLQSTQQFNMVNTVEQGLLGYNAYAADYPLVLDLYKDRNLSAVKGKTYGYNVVSTSATCGGLIVQFNYNQVGHQESVNHAAKIAAK